MVYGAFDVETYCKYDNRENTARKILIGLKEEEFKVKEKELIEGYYYPVLDGTGEYFIAGSLVLEDEFKKVFYDKKEMWEFIKELGRKYRKNGKCLYLFAHNIKYDFYNIFERDNNLSILCENPFIGIYNIKEEKKIKKEKWDRYEKHLRLNNKFYSYKEKEEEVIVEFKTECIKFLDSMNLFSMSLKRLGDLIKYEKLEMPKVIKDIKELKELETYVLRDSEIVIESIKMLREKLKEDKVHVKRIMTINQIAIAYLLKMMKREECQIFKSKKSENIIQSKYRNKIRKAYRAGRVEVWKIGKFDNVTYIDCNSLYPYSATKIKFPDVKTETYYNEPKKEYWKTLISKIGVSRVLLYNKSNEIGLIASRQPTLSYIPKENSYLIGTWTNLEIEKALEEGYELINMEWSIVYEELENPFKKIMEKLYEKRKLDTEKKFDYNFYKSMMNNGIGKFTQIKTGQEIVFDDLEKTKEYVNRNYEVLGGISDSSLIMKFKKKPEQIKYKKYYCPIITALITANARIIMYDMIKKIGVSKMVYMDTDSCIFEGSLKDINVNISNNLGDFKVIQENDKFETYGRKSYTPADNIMRLSGVKKSNNEINRKKGVIKYFEMEGISKNRIGRFIEKERDIKKQVIDYLKQERLLKEIKIFIDNDILKESQIINTITNKTLDSISYFANDIIKIGIDINKKEEESERYINNHVLNNLNWE